jgi:DNA-binding transcriptional ArsR family regulator
VIETFAALAEPNRFRIVELLRSGPRPVNEIGERLQLNQPQVSKHLRVLRQVGLVEARDEGRRRIYRLNGRSLKPIHDWVGAYERTWTQRLDRLDAVVAELKDEEGDGGDDE